ncbi:hypothetical protein KEJ18_01105 [Candidatus Bathyarchaeota archaeon]|nr:hypothetical protein [Candidatus Bathyarchaeota archaeon]
MSYEAKIVEALRKSDGKLSTIELARETGLPKTTLIKYLTSFKMSGKADFEDVGVSRIWRLVTPTKVKSFVKKKELDKMLKKLVEDTNLSGCAVVDREGFVLSAFLPYNVTQEKLGYLANLLFEVNEKIAMFSGIQYLHRTIFEGSEETIFSRYSGNYVFIAFLKHNAMLWPLRQETESLIKRINGVLIT